LINSTVIDKEMIKDVCDGIIKQISREYMIECEKNREFPTKLWNAMVEGGLLQLGFSEEYGGIGGGLTEQVYSLDLLSSAGLGPVVVTPNGLARIPILKYGTEEQKQKYLRATTTGDIKFAFMITEPNAGTNAMKMESLAVRQPNGDYKLNGQKIFISGFDHSDYSLLVCRTTAYKDVKDRREGLSLFIINSKSPGIEAYPQNIALPLAEKQFTVYFNDVIIPKENLIGEEGKGIRYLFDGLNPERLFAAAHNVGNAEFLLNKAVAYAKERAPFDQPIGSYQSIQHPLAYVKAHIEATRGMIYKACELFDQGKAREAAMYSNISKLLAADVFREAADITAQVHGGYALDEDYDIAYFIIASRGSGIAPANNQLILNYIGEHVLGLPKSY
jgi:acyl-CoA dehydrogenase